MNNQGTGVSVTFLGVSHVGYVAILHVRGRGKLLRLSASTTKKETQWLIGQFGF